MEAYAAKASESLRRLSDVEISARAGSAQNQASGEGLGRAVKVEWNGPAEPIIGKLAAMAGFQAVVSGKQPSTPLIVAVNVSSIRISDALKDIGVQAGNQMDVIVHSSARVIEIRYAANFTSGGGTVGGGRSAGAPSVAVRQDAWTPGR
jgi:hypothetical protein